MASLRGPHAITGAVFSPDACNYDVTIVTEDHGHVEIQVHARSIIAAHNLAIASYLEHGTGVILYVQSINRITPESEIA